MNFGEHNITMMVNKDLIPRRDYYNKVIDSWLELCDDENYPKTIGERILVFCENTCDLFKLLYNIVSDRKDIMLSKQYKSINQCVIELYNNRDSYLRFEIHNIIDASESMRGHRCVSLIFDLTEILLSEIPISEDIYNHVLLPLVWSRTEDKPYHNVTILYYDL